MSKIESNNEDSLTTPEEDAAFDHVDMVQKLPNRMDVIAGLTLRDKRCYNQEGKKDYQGPLYAPHPDIKK